MRERHHRHDPSARGPRKNAGGYWTSLERELGERLAGLDGPSALCGIELVEERALADVLPLIEDREFPSDLRDRVAAAVSRWRISSGSSEARAHARRTGRSGLLEELHGAFAELAGRHVETRWGVLTDDPAAMVRDRERHSRRPGSGDGYNL